MGRAADLRLREALEEAIAEHSGDAAHARGAVGEQP
jgi:hypothetical protein